ncbi:MAG: hypothetical protein IJ852_05290 [Alphaproteobacteria bacterium]|nr:hypothetical protein [Alphaproteobacteria bacterium]
MKKMLTALSVCTLLIFGLIIYNRLHTRSTAPRELHVFLESYATNPAFSQIIEYVKLPQSTRKIIAWHRFPNRADILDLKAENTIEIPLQKGEFHWQNSTYRVLFATLFELIKDPDLQLIFHANMRKMNTVLRPFLTWIPKDRIAHIHLYEDGYGELFKNELWRTENQKSFSPESLQKGLKNSTHWDDLMILQLHRFYPVTYHFYAYDTAKKDPQFHSMIEFLHELNIENIDFSELNQTLDNAQKQKIYHLSGFDYAYYADLMKNKKTVIYLMGYHPIDKENEAFERLFLHRLREDETFTQIKAADYLWFYKPHPSFQASAAASVIKQEFPDMIEINARIPFEIFILSGLRPNYVAGYSSSAFYPMEKDEILYFIKRPWDDFHNRLGDAYAAFLLNVRHVDENRLITFNEALKNFVPRRTF